MPAERKKRIREDQKRLQIEVSSIRTQSAIKLGDDYRSEERAAIHAIPPEIFYGFPPRQNQHNTKPPTVDTTAHASQFRRHR